MNYFFSNAKVDAVFYDDDGADNSHRVILWTIGPGDAGPVGLIAPEKGNCLLTVDNFPGFSHYVVIEE